MLRNQQGARDVFRAFDIDPLPQESTVARIQGPTSSISWRRLQELYFIKSRLGRAEELARAEPLSSEVFIDLSNEDVIQLLICAQ